MPITVYVKAFRVLEKISDAAAFALFRLMKQREARGFENSLARR